MCPAHPGEPRAQARTRAPPRGWPRRYGGSLPGPGAARGAGGSILAHTGDPRRSPSPECRAGGARCRNAKRVNSGGLSPLLRGNHLRHHRRRDLGRSIPAHTGEPRWGSAAQSAGRVYPRTCGGTRHRQERMNMRTGLSPHMRGNQRPCEPRRTWHRSIPAHAGEPEN